MKSGRPTMITRRESIACLVGILALAPRISFAKPPPGKATTIAILSSGADRDRPIFAAFRKRLRELGYEDGNNVRLAFYFPSGDQPLTALAQAIVRANPAVVVADGSAAAKAVASLTRSIPVVAVAGDPVTRGLAASLAHPGSNVTGVSSISEELDIKELEILCEIVPTARRIGVVGSGQADKSYRQLEERAASMGVSLRKMAIRSRADAEHELTPAALNDVDALIVPANALLGSLSATLARLIDIARKPAIYGDRDFVAVGGLAFYGISIEDAFHRGAELVDRVLNGANPAETPFEQPSRVELVVNMRTAKALQLSVPQSLLLRADEVIE